MGKSTWSVMKFLLSLVNDYGSIPVISSFLLFLYIGEYLPCLISEIPAYKPHITNRQERVI